jgi:hypothetical protein
MEPVAGGLRVDSTPWAEVYLDGRNLGRTPLVSGEVPSGSHELVLINKDRGLEYRETLQIAGGETAKKRYVFNGTLDFTGVQAGMEILLGDRRLGTAPLQSLSLPVGSYEITLRDPGSRTEARLPVRVSTNTTTRVKEDDPGYPGRD